MIQINTELSVLFVVALDALKNFFMSIGNATPTFDFYPLTFFEIFIVLEEVLDLI